MIEKAKLLIAARRGEVTSRQPDNQERLDPKSLSLGFRTATSCNVGIAEICFESEDDVYKTTPLGVKVRQPFVCYAVEIPNACCQSKDTAKNPKRKARAGGRADPAEPTCAQSELFTSERPIRAGRVISCLLPTCPFP